MRQAKTRGATNENQQYWSAGGGRAGSAELGRPGAGDTVREPSGRGCVLGWTHSGRIHGGADRAARDRRAAAGTAALRRPPPEAGRGLDGYARVATSYGPASR